MFQFGYAIADFNILTTVLYKQYQNKGNPVLEDEKSFNSIVTTIVPIGAAIGSFSGGQIWKIGRRKSIFIINAVLIVGSGLIINLYFG